MLYHIEWPPTFILEKMLDYTQLMKGTLFVLDGKPCEVLESHFLRMQQRKAVQQVKYRELTTGKVLDRNFQASDYFEEADVEKKKAMFIYAHRDEFWFTEEGNPKNRFSLPKESMSHPEFLKPNTPVQLLTFNAKVIGITLPVKMDLKVTEAPPAIKGNTAQGGTKMVTLEGGASVSAPLFINEGDMVRVNTETGEYVERVDKG